MYGTYPFNGLTSRGTMDGKPSLRKAKTRLVFPCCDVAGEGFLTTRCWVCMENTGVCYDSLDFSDNLRIKSSGAHMSFEEPSFEYQATLYKIRYEYGVSQLPSPA